MTMPNRRQGIFSDTDNIEELEPRSGSAEETRDYPTGLKFWLVIIKLGALLVLGGLDTNIVATAVPSISNHFHTVADVGWYSSAFRPCSCALQFIFGKMYKLFSVKRIFLLASVIFLLGSLLCSTTTTSAMFVAGRAITGVGFAGIIRGFFTILTHIVPLRKRPFYCGMWEVSKALPCSALPSLVDLFIALSWASTKYPWDDGKVIGLLVTFAVLIATFSLNQRRGGDTAALPPRIMKNRNVIAGAIFTMCTNSAINVLEYYLPTYYQVVHEYSPSKSGYMMAPIVVGSALGMFLCGSGTSMVGYYTPFMLFSSITMPIFAGLITTFGVNTDIARLISYTGASGLASGIAFNAPMSAVQTVLSTEDVSLGLSIVLFAQHFGPRSLSSNLAGLIPNLTSTDIGNNGLMEITGRAPPALHNAVLAGVSRSISVKWYVAVGLTCATLVGSLLMEWRSVKEKKT
ncbi:efflux pump antibiotic resistance protein [Cucurbitaria berberidis CBS 394.84]|uniref:Efflux pump antibiotic resistance protein n=1 Tax=Cucurbitaria berberidis CBS 394.84 TaxID=1168544 RepID=A0A9P4GHM4_9PLEO|nr:efflux pump antibiotic resistance protein [Cucurbitaria berberidis CBS 394.84]KAF1846318.1 efflux pump antibiotic resistance protein [Cucurbitaria berberidis CBS 394.84]